jgi:hypothetical protein
MPLYMIHVAYTAEDRAALKAVETTPPGPGLRPAPRARHPYALRSHPPRSTPYTRSVAFSRFWRVPAIRSRRRVSS